MAITINDIFDNIKKNLIVTSEESIDSLTTEQQLFIVQSFADDLRPSLFYNTDIGRLIDSHINILTYYGETFKVDGVFPSNYHFNTISEDISKTMWSIKFNKNISENITNLNNYFEVETIRKIYNIICYKMTDNIYYNPQTDEYEILNSLKLTWEYIGVGEFDVYYKIGNGNYIPLYDNLSTNWCVFVLTNEIQSALNNNVITFKITSHTSPLDIHTISKSFNSNLQTTGAEIVTEQIISNSVYTAFSDVMKRDVIEITRPLSLVSNYRDLLKLTISSYLIDDENIELGKKLVTNYYTHDKFKIDSISIDDNKLSDPNIVTIIFNKNLDELQNITQLIQYYGGDTYPADGTVNFDYSIVNNTLNISLLTVLDKSHQYYRMVIGDIISIDGDVLSQSGVEYEFITNHNIIFIGKNVVLSDETNSIVILS